jgi:hypothetical protein
VADPQPISAHHTFNRAALSTLNESLAILDQRGGEYQDSWATENMQSPFLNNIFREFGVTLDKEQTRLVMLAALCDVKLSRLAGPWKRDTAVDLINYLGALAQLHDDRLERLSKAAEEASIPPPRINPEAPNVKAFTKIVMDAIEAKTKAAEVRAGVEPPSVLAKGMAVTTSPVSGRTQHGEGGIPVTRAIPGASS